MSISDGCARRLRFNQRNPAIFRPCVGPVIGSLLCRLRNRKWRLGIVSDLLGPLPPDLCSFSRCKTSASDLSCGRHSPCKHSWWLSRLPFPSKLLKSVSHGCTQVYSIALDSVS